MDGRFLAASQEYLHRRHEIALRLLAECDKQAAGKDAGQEESLRDQAFIALAQRSYVEAAALTRRLAREQERREHLQLRRRELVLECDRLGAGRTALEDRKELLERVPPTIEDPYIGGVSGYLEKRHETALRLVAALDGEIANVGPDETRAGSLRIKREHLSIEVDTLLAAMQVQEDREELLSTAEEKLGDSTLDTSAYLRRVLAYLGARSDIVLKLIASIDRQLSAGGDASEGNGDLKKQRAELVEELDRINEKAAAQKRGEAELQACGLRSDVGDPYHIKITAYLQSRSDIALQLIAFLDGRLESLNRQGGTDEERERLAAQRSALSREADDALAQIAQQEKMQPLMESLGTVAVAREAFM